ncbi:hypothetical protein [Algoriphagus alkaliphilus]|uniref:hypothetical protein n=1 Tax=Algoriphagus alkaliphilus TaxID=279824 RepID=UPI0011132FE3|nr:hypothetical protein [Algoriphagus alkaliphilus]
MSEVEMCFYSLNLAFDSAQSDTYPPFEIPCATVSACLPQEGTHSRTLDHFDASVSVFTHGYFANFYAAGWSLLTEYHLPP